MIIASQELLQKSPHALNGYCTEWKYLYFTIQLKNRNCTFTPTLSDLGCRANKAIYSLLSRLPIKIAPVKSMLEQFDIVPILLYVNEAWAPFVNHDCIKWEVTQIK